MDFWMSLTAAAPLTSLLFNSSACFFSCYCSLSASCYQHHSIVYFADIAAGCLIFSIIGKSTNVRNITTQIILETQRGNIHTPMV
jgi:hypothetical protein